MRLGGTTRPRYPQWSGYTISMGSYGDLFGLEIWPRIMSYFSHLHGHDQSSLLDAMTRPHELFERVASIDQVAVGTTNHGNMYSVAEMLKTSKKYGIKHIAGCEFYVANLGLEDRSARDSYHLTVLCDGSKQGWKNLCNLHYLSFAKGFYYNPRIDLDVLGEHSEGLIALSGCMGGMAPKAYLTGNEAEAERRIKLLKQIFGPERFFIELQNHGLENDAILLPWLRKVAKKFALKTVATNDFHYANKKDSQAHDTLIAIGKNQCVFDPNRAIAYEPEQFFVKDYDEMAEMGFSKAELEQSHKITEMCEPLNLESKIFHIPAIEVPKGYFNPPPKSPKYSAKKLVTMYFVTEVQKGLIRRYGTPLPSEVTKRSTYEENAIIEAGFTDYMMIVADIYDFMRKDKIPYGPGRGSVAGSIVAYALGITEVDPLRYNLLFERFINPERVSLPDVDMDVSAIHRDKVIAYLKHTYGVDKTANLITFQSIGGRAAIRDVGRAYRLPLEKVDILAKAIPLEGSQTKDRESRAYLSAALSSQKILRKAYESDDLIKQVIDAGISLEGVTKAASKHAAGIVISDTPLRDLVPMGIKTKGDDPDPNVVGFEMGFIEAMGLIKFDLLGLRNVDVVADCIADMKRHKVIGKAFSPNDIPTDDVATFQMLCRGLTAGLFQIEGSGMTGWLKKLQPDRIEDIMAMVALFRPGPMEHIPRYIERKHGREEVTYPHESLEPILKDTFGVPVYQEQLMQIGQTIAGWSLARADQLRKVIGKKIVDDIDKERRQFADDAAKNGFNWDWADDLFAEFIEPAAKYGFNSAHSTAYGLLAYQTAYLKCNYPIFYFAALLKSIEDHPKRDEKMSEYIADAREMGVAILPPDVNQSSFSFTAIPSEKCVRFGLNGIKHVGSKAVVEIIEERKHGSFDDLFRTVERIKSTLCNSRCVEALVASGAMDSMSGTRAEKLASLPNALERADCLREDKRRVAGGGKPVKRKKPIPDPVLLEASEDKIELLAKERELIGYYLSGHPWLDVTSSSASHSVQEAREAINGSTISVGGIVSRLTEHTTKKNKQKMFFGAIEDDKAVLEFVVFPRQYEALAGLLKLDMPVVVSGRIENDVSEDSEEATSSAKIIISSADPIARGLKKKAQKPMFTQVITLPREGYRAELQKWRDLLDKNEDITDLKFILPDGSCVKVVA